MNKVSLAFFSGSLVPATAIFLLGGTSQACLVAGMLLVLIPALLFAREVGDWLYWVADAVEAVRGVQASKGTLRREHLQSQAASRITGEAAGENYPRRRVAVMSGPSTSDKELESALVNLGCPKGKARLIASKIPAGTFEERLRQATKLAA
jgi:hypothetical protein